LFSGSAIRGEVQIGKRTDVILNSEKNYLNPYLDVAVSAVFTHQTGGDEIRLAGFWNGGNEWRVRFSPTRVGEWHYTITSDADDSGLTAAGSITAVANTGATALDRHGFVKICDNKRYFTYNDGTPFYWLGDTHWQAPNYVSITQCNYPGCTCGNQFKHEVDNRLAKGFTVYQTYFDSGESDGGGQRATTGEPGLWLDRHTKINPVTFTEKIDVMFDYLAENGMVIALGYGVHNNTTDHMTEKALLDITRYLTARYASYPIVWITAQEINITANSLATWKKSAALVNELDGYGHPQGAHLLPTNAGDAGAVSVNAEPWHEWWPLQGGHEGPPLKAFYQGYWNNTRVKPFIETEANYEDVECGGFNGYNHSRISAWKANLCGSYGFTYGVTGMWANGYSTAGNTGWLGSFSYEPWYMGLDKPGSFEMTYLRNFFEYAGFSTLIPRFNDSRYSNFSTEEKLVASSEDADLYAGYFYNRNRTTGVLKGLDSSRNYSARWYNPLTGKFIDITDLAVVDGIFVIPDKPTAGDWALLVTCRDLGPYQTESPYRDVRVDRENNLALGADAKAGTYNEGPGFSYPPGLAVDGNLSTYWCARNENMPQWIKLDLGKSRLFNQITLDLHDPNTQYTFVISGSNDLSVWESATTDGWHDLYAAKAATPAGTRFVIDIAEAEYQYVQVRFTAVSGGHWGAIHEWGIYRRLEDDLPPVRLPFEGEKRYPLVTSIGSGVYTAAGVYSNTAGALFDDDPDTEWRPFAPIATQTVRMDLQARESLSGIAVTLGPNGFLPQYRIEGSGDGKEWTILVDATLRAPQVIAENGRTTVCEALSGEYRFVKLLWLNGANNSSRKTIGNIDLYVKKDDTGIDSTGSVSGSSSRKLKISRSNRQVRFEVETPATVWIYNCLGALVERLKVQNEQSILLPQGVYLVKSVSNGGVESVKIRN
jgi:hypothetical protein